MSIINDPFGNESEAAQIGDLNIENRVDQITLYGSLNITCDKAGLQRAEELKSLFDSVVSKLQSLDLPDQIEILKPTTGDNPFE